MKSVKRAVWMVGLSVALLACDSEPGQGQAPGLDTVVPDDVASRDAEDDASPIGDSAEPLDLSEPPDTRAPELPRVEDVGPPQEEVTDDVAVPPDVPEPEASPFGEVVGPCDTVLDPLDDTPAVVVNTFVFDGDPFDPDDLSDDAEVVFNQPNAGGSSRCSEVFSVEVMRLCADADLYKTETEIAYTEPGPLTDYAVFVEAERVGVSVTRAYKGPVIDMYSTEDATTLLEKKLAGINESTANVTPEDAWVRQVLHVWTLHPEWADTVADAWEALSPALKADTLVLITVESGSDFVVTDSCDD